MKLDNGDHFLSSCDGVVVKNMKINNCGGEGIRLRYFVTHCTLFHNRITSTGCYDFKFGKKGDQGIKNGEGICELDFLNDDELVALIWLQNVVRVFT